MIKQYPYRFKTEAEFIKQYGNYWLDYINWNNNEMNYLFGTPFPFNIIEYDFLNDNIPRYLPYIPTYGGEEYWFIEKNMLITNIIKPSYKSKQIIY